ncbi:MAG: Aminodeoxychorismate synthase component 2 [Alphaproteobacteria bacterium MarineAlpha9_Bin4]|nr:aminodeoxychorismate/anthranilate synthase component II [Pelagibacterales bacterium]PPR27621.1 MAG: Aminodeoxychorismate synthase component 2 [Alphaproteobacteria bacterium MarineAlpha9_Bin4]|tara:strand:- start:689 stop:1285 length:597 start_codon:yes stop_codon:yes gene_type:complete
MFLLVDNYDSFTWNIYHSIASMGAKVVVRRSDKINLSKLSDINYKGIIFSPGPGHPKDSHAMIEIISKLKKRLPLLGICLGHQALAFSFGAKVTKMKKIMHGKTDKISIIKRSKIFNNIPSNFLATRYHSLEVHNKNLPKDVQVLALSNNNTIMAIKIKKSNIYGIQFHPESIASEYGEVLFYNFINLCNIKKNNEYN